MTKTYAALLGSGVVALLVLFVASHPATATPVFFTFDAILETGDLPGTTFVGSFSYDTAGSTGVGMEFLPLTSLDFVLLGVPFTLADIKQGGQVILEDGAFSLFRAAFLPPPPAGSPVSDIAFGFGGPGVIGYAVPPGLSDIGSGQYFAHPRVTPAPSTLVCLGLGMLAMAAIATTRARRRQTAST